MSDQDNQSLHMAQSIRSKKYLLIGLTLLVAVIGFVLPREQPYFFSFEHGYADLRTRILSQGQSEQYKDVIYVRITEKALNEMAYRSPIDRKWISELIVAVDAQKPKVIALDVLIDQATEKAKDDQLLAVIKSARSPIVLVSADSRGKLTPEQREYHTQFLEKSKARSGFVNIVPDEDGIVRELPAAVDSNHPSSFADVVFEVAMETVAPKPKYKERISWLKSVDKKFPPFRERVASFVRNHPNEDLGLTGKIVLIGADLPYTDKHKTPFADAGRIKSDTSGTLILAQIIAQRLDGRHVTMLPYIFEFILYLIAALAGLLLAADTSALSRKAKIFSTMGFAALIIDAIFFKFFSLLIPTAMIIFVFGFSAGLPAIFAKLTRWISLIFNKKGRVS